MDECKVAACRGCRPWVRESKLAGYGTEKGKGELQREKGHREWRERRRTRTYGVLAKSFWCFSCCSCAVYMRKFRDTSVVLG